MKASIKKILEYIRIVWVLARKDIWDGLKNKNVLVLLFSVGFLVVFYKFLPELARGKEPTNVVVYDAGKSSLTAGIERSPNLTARTNFDSEEEMLQSLRFYDLPELGLVLPADFDKQLEEEQSPILTGYTMYWLAKQDALSLRDAVEAELSRLAGKPVSISIDGNIIYNLPDQDGAGSQASFAIILALVMIGISLIPNILIDEKQARTLDALMVSPASETQIAAGKAAAGLFYSGVAAALILAVNHSLVMHWGLAVAAVVCFGLLAVLLGLILGTAVETRAQFQLMAWVLIIPMVLPLVLFLVSDLLPEIVGKILPIFPPVTMQILLRYVYADPISWESPLLGLGWLLAWVAVELGVVSWVLRRRDRAEKPIAAANGLAQPISQRNGPLAAPRTSDLKAMERTRREISEPESTAGRGGGLRIVFAIFIKDTREAFRNRLFLSIMLGMVLLAFNGALLPALINWRDLPSAAIYDEGNSAAVRELAGREDCQVILAASQSDMERAVTGSYGTTIGMVIPPDFDQRLGVGGEIELIASTAHWVDTEKANRLIAFFQEKLSQSGSAEVQIRLSEIRLYPTAEAGGQPMLSLFTQVMVLFVIGFILVPLLLVEEKESRTMDMLMVSPAGYRQILAGKTVTGVAYCLFAGAVIVLLNARWIVHWDILLAAVLLASAFVVSVGLLIGSLAGTPTTAAFWGSPLLLVMVASIIALLFRGMELPAWLESVITWSPAALILQLFRLALAGVVPANQVWQSIAALAGMTATLYIVVLAIMRRKYSV